VASSYRPNTEPVKGRLAVNCYLFEEVIMQIEDFVARLENVKTKGRGQYLCSCPAHADSDPSLAVTQTPNGKILVKCFAGCSALEIVHSMQLTLEDLFADAYQENPMAFAQREIASRRKVLDKIEYAKTYLGLVTAQLKAGQVVDEKAIIKAYKLKNFLEEQGAA
jgi:hypothetical protein